MTDEKSCYTVDLGHIVLRLFVTHDGMIRVHLAIPAEALTPNIGRGVHLNAEPYGERPLISEFEPEELAIDYAVGILRGTRAPAAELSRGYRVGFELDIPLLHLNDASAALYWARNYARELRGTARGAAPGVTPKAFPTTALEADAHADVTAA